MDSRDQSADRRNSREQPGSWQPVERKKNQHIRWKQQFTSFIGLVVYQNQFCHKTVFTTCTFKQQQQQQPPHIQASLKDTFLTLTTCSIKLNMAIKIHNNVKQKWVMQIMKASEDIAAISACVCVCVCQQKQIKHFNDFWPGWWWWWWLCRKVLPVLPSLWAIIQLSLLKKLRNSLSLHSCQANSAAVY